jgi:hypothetical protein
MSEKLSKALEFANYRSTLNNQRAILKAKVESLLSYSIDGGTFTIDPGLISFVKLLKDEGMETAVLIDIYDNPISVELEDFYTEILSRYTEATNDYHAEYGKLTKARSVKSILDISDD